MALEEILGNLTKTPGEPGANPQYNPETLTKTLNYITELSQANLSTKEGLEKYTELTGLPIREISPERIAPTKKQIDAELNERLIDYANIHIGSITKEISLEDQFQIAYGSCPAEKSNSEKYEIPRAIIQDSKGKIKMIKEKPQEYISGIINDSPDFMKGIVGRFSNEVLDIDARDSQKKAFGAIEKYGPTKFITDTYAPQISIEEEISKKRNRIEQERKTLIQSMETNLDAQGQAEYFAPIMEKEKSLQEEMNKISGLNELRSTIIQTAIATIKGKQAADDYAQQQAAL